MLILFINLHIIPNQMRLNYHSPAKYRLETEQNCNFITLYFTILYNTHYFVFFKTNTDIYTSVSVCHRFSLALFCVSPSKHQQQLLCNSVPCCNVFMLRAYFSQCFSVLFIYFVHFLFQIITTNKHTFLQWKMLK